LFSYTVIDPQLVILPIPIVRMRGQVMIYLTFYFCRLAANSRETLRPMSPWQRPYRTPKTRTNCRIMICVCHPQTTVLSKWRVPYF